MVHQELTINEKLLKTITPTLKIFRIMGIFPVTYDNYKITWSVTLYTFSFLAATLVAIWGIWGFVDDMTTASFLTLGFRGTVDFFITSFEVSEIIASGFYFVISTKGKSKNIRTILINFDKIDNMITPIFVRKIRRKSIFVTSFVLSFMIVLYIFDLFMWGNNSWRGLNNYMGYYILFTVSISHEVLYWHWVNLIYYRVLAMNNYVEDLEEKDISCESISYVVTAYDCICECIEKFNTCFGNSATLIILSCYINLVVCPYVLFVMMSSNEISLLNYVYFVWIGVHICRLFVLMNVCHSCEYLKGKTSSLVFRLLTQPLGDNTRKKVKTLAFKTTKMKIRFSAYGLPKVNRHLILSVISSISTYWMILIQFSARLET
ncbi:hypothetical protein Zmor_017870 [Zophobas morio]|uniref:Gustatory receptor n=1 Tax=Zophobas morio TaxID=2755281 RepID=A0AA38MD51_9CUCU|nr:hypothetical protein Zmor_017870 [Zophobas morio]